MTANLRRTYELSNIEKGVAYLIKVLSQNIPEIWPFQPDSIHVVIRYLDKFLEAK